MSDHEVYVMVARVARRTGRRGRASASPSPCSLKQRYVRRASIDVGADDRSRRLISGRASPDAIASRPTDEKQVRLVGDGDGERRLPIAWKEMRQRPRLRMAVPGNGGVRADTV